MHWASKPDVWSEASRSQSIFVNEYTVSTENATMYLEEYAFKELGCHFIWTSRIIYGWYGKIYICYPINSKIWYRTRKTFHQFLFNFISYLLTTSLREPRWQKEHCTGSVSSWRWNILLKIGSWKIKICYNVKLFPSFQTLPVVQKFYILF